MKFRIPGTPVSESNPPTKFSWSTIKVSRMYKKIEDFLPILISTSLSVASIFCILALKLFNLKMHSSENLVSDSTLKSFFFVYPKI